MHTLWSIFVWFIKLFVAMSVAFLLATVLLLAWIWLAGTRDSHRA